MMQWGWPFNSKKAHVFSNMRALCGKWLFSPPSDQPAITSVANERGPDDCAACHKKLVAHFKPSRKAAADNMSDSGGGK